MLFRSEAEGEGEVEVERPGLVPDKKKCPGHVPDKPPATQDGQAPSPPATDQDGLLLIPQGLEWETLNPLRKARAEIRHLAREIREGKTEAPKDRDRLESWKQKFNDYVKDLT